MKFDVRGKVFDITFVNNYVRERYTEMLELVDDLSDHPDKMSELMEGEDRAEMRHGLRHIKEEQRRLVREIAEMRADMLNEILTTNDYPYDAEWWKRKTDVDDINNFVFDCIQKDVKGDKPKKK